MLSDYSSHDGIRNRGLRVPNRVRLGHSPNTTDTYGANEGRDGNPPSLPAAAGVGSNREFEAREWGPANTTLEAAKLLAREFGDSAAKQGFKPGMPEILAKMADSDIIYDFRSRDGSPAAFGSLLTPIRISFGKVLLATLVYLNGLIVNPRFARRGLCKEFLRAAGSKADIVVGHTQNPKILDALRKVYPFVWPSPDHLELRASFSDVIAKYLKSIGRPENFDRVTGLVPDLYPGPLYEQPSSTDTSGFPNLAGGDGTLLIASDSKEIFAEVVERLSDSDIRPPSSVMYLLGRAAGGPFDSVVVGAGHAGQMQLSCIQKAAQREPEVISGRVAMVECNVDVAARSGVHCFRTIAEAQFDPAKTVVHVATGPADRVAVVREAAKLGFWLFVLEKPLTSSRSDQDELIQLVHDFNLKVVVNLPWLATPLTRTLKEAIDSHEHGRLLELYSRQTKSRRGRLNEAAGHQSALDIETPHQVSLDLYLAGQPATLREATCRPLVSETGAISLMGGASMLLSHRDAISYLVSDLDCGVKERLIELRFADGWQYFGWYPVSGETDGQYLWRYDADNRLVDKQTFSDDPLTSLFLQSYRYFAGVGPQPVSTLEIALATANLIFEAKSYCGLALESAESFTPGAK